LLPCCAPVRRKKKQPVACLLEYNDGFRAAVVALGGLVNEYVVALRVKGTDHSIAVFEAQGRRLGEIPMPEDPSNCAWGDGFRNLYVTAKTSVYRIETKVNGTRTY